MYNSKLIWPVWKIAMCYSIAFVLAALPLFIMGQGWTGEIIILIEHLLKNQHDMLSYLASAYADPENIMATDPTRILHALPIALAFWTPWPDRVLDVAFLVTWVGVSLSVWKLTLLLFPRNTKAAFVAGIVTVLTAFDVSEMIVSYYPHLLSLLIFMLALILLVSWWLYDSVFKILFSFLLLSTSMLIYGLAAPSIPFSILLLIAVSVANRTKINYKKLILAATVWGIPLVTYAAVLKKYASSFPKGTSTAAAVNFNFTVDHLLLWLKMILLNFNPLAWLDLYPFFWIQETSYGNWILIATATMAALWGVLAVTAMDKGDRVGTNKVSEWRRFYIIGCGLILMAVASNISFSNLIAAESMFRTHLVSQIPAAIIIGYILAAFLDSSNVYRLSGTALMFLILFCGAWSVAKRSQHLVSTWRSHGTELASLAENIANISDKANIILYRPKDAGFNATVVSWHARGWLGVMRGTVQPQDQFFLWSANTTSNCAPYGESILCYGGSQQSVQFDAKNVIVLGYDPATHKYHIINEELRLGASYKPTALLLTSPKPLPPIAEQIIQR